MAVLATAGLMVVRRSDVECRPVVAIALLAQFVVWSGVNAGHLDALIGAITVLAWVLPTEWFGGALLGLACAIKPNGWFMVPAIMATAWQRGGRLATIRVGVGGVAGFAVVSLPWIILSPHQWWTANTFFINGGLFPLGYGAIGLVTSGLLSTAWLPLFAVAPVVVSAVAVIAAWMRDRVMPGIGALIALFALWMGTRSLLDYMVAAGILAVAVVATGASDRASQTA